MQQENITHVCKSWPERAVQQLLLIILWGSLLCVPVVMATYCMMYPELCSWRELPVVAVAAAIYLLAARFIAGSKLTDSTITAIAFALANVVMIASITIIDTVPCSDYKVLWEYACEMADGTYVPADNPATSYMGFYSFQTGITLLESLVISIFGKHFIALQILCLLLVNLTIWLTGVLAARLTDRRCAALAMLLTATFYPVLVTVNQFTNQHIAAPLILLSLLCLMRRGAGMWALGAVIAAVLNYLRPEGVLLVATAVVTGLLRLRRGNILRPVAGIIAFVIVYQSLIFVFDTATIRGGYASWPVSELHAKYFKFDKGLTGYDRPDDLERLGNDIDRFNDWEKEKLATMLTGEPLTIASFVTTKMVRYLGGFDWKFENTFNHDQEVCLSYPVKAFTMVGWGQYIALLALAIIGYSRWRRIHAVDPVQIFYIGVVCVYFFIEAFSSYRYESYPILLIFSAAGLLRSRS